MANLQEIKQRIKATQKTGQITNAIKLVSTARYSQIKNQKSNYQVYAEKLESIIAHLASKHSLLGDEDVPLLKKRTIKQSAIMVISSDRGLVGGYNQTVFENTRKIMQEKKLTKENTKIIAIGEHAIEYFQEHGYNTALTFSRISDVPSFNEVRFIVENISQAYFDGEFDELIVNYNHFKNRITNEFNSVKIFPISEENFQFAREDSTELYSSYEFLPTESAELFNLLLPQYAQSIIYSYIIDAKIAEHSASINAMTTATENVDDLISKLNVQYNRARQAAITTEITEITGGMTVLED